MSDDDIRDMVYDLVRAIDYDIYKELDDEQVDSLVVLAKKHIKNTD